MDVASNVSPSGLIKEDSIFNACLRVEEVGTLFLNLADGGIQFASLGGKLQIVLKLNGQKGVHGYSKLSSVCSGAR